MKKGIILFDIKDFLYQGMERDNPNIDLINEKQSESLKIMHREMKQERERRIKAGTQSAIVDLFLPTGDGYYMLCEPDLVSILDISQCIVALLKANEINAYCVAHIGEVIVFTDMTGKQNATGFELGYASRLQSISKQDGKLVCSKQIVNMWDTNPIYALDTEWQAGIGKDGITYQWKTAVPLNFEREINRFKK